MEYNWNRKGSGQPEKERAEMKEERVKAAKRPEPFVPEEKKWKEGKRGMKERSAEVQRKTKETEIRLFLNLDGRGEAEVSTGIGFLDHMLESFARHGLFDLRLECKGDLYVDCHHTVEDVGIVLGTAIKKALGDKAGISRYGSFLLPMDDALVLCALDLSGRAYFNYEVEHPTERVGYLDTEMVREFFLAVCHNGEMNLHMKQISGTNSHHIIEAEFKAFAKALDAGVRRDGRFCEVLSTKGSL